MVKTRKDRRDRRSTRGLAPNCIRHGSILSAALLLSWFVEPTRSIWLALDENFFWATNDTLARGRPWQVLWAVANFRAVDLLAALSMVGLYAHYVLRRGRDETSWFDLSRQV